MAKAIAAVVVLVTLGIAGGVTVVHEHNAELVGRAVAAGRTTLVIGELVSTKYAQLFDTMGAAAIGAWPSSPDGAIALQVLSESVPAPEAIWLNGGTERFINLSVSSKQFSDLLQSPRGTWLSYQKEISDARSGLERALILVETVDASETQRAYAKEHAIARREELLAKIEAAPDEDKK
jgi:hypothetical protein